jgi:hypothetical protein
MPELPIIVEPTLHSYLLSGALGGTLVLVLLYAFWERMKRPPKLTVTDILGFVALTAFGMLLLLQPVGWCWRIDENGMTLHAPFVLYQSSASLSWAEMTGMQVVIGRGRSAVYYQLEVDGQQGPVIEFNGLDSMPKSFAAPLVAAVTHYAPHARLSPDAKGFAEHFAAVLGENVPTHDPMSEPIRALSSSYRVRIGDRVLK